MSLQDELLELNAVYQSVAAENEALRALLADYDQFIEEYLSDQKLEPVRLLTKRLGLGEMLDNAFVAKRDELKERYDALMQGGKP